MMKSLASIAPTLVTLLLATSLTNAAGAPVFQFTDFMVGSKTCRGCMQCRVGSSEPPFYPFSFVIGNDYCVDLNGIISVETTYGLLTVDFNSEAIGNTDIHLTFPNGTWIGGTAPSKSSGYSATMDTTGTGQWGTPNYVGGWCVANIIQYQKVDPSAAVTDPDGQYSYNISLYDNSRNWIGGTDGGPLFVENSQTGGIDSLLPSVFEITSGNVDIDPYTISYSQPYLPSPVDEVWSAYDSTHQCGFANLLPNGGHNDAWGYANGARTNNCGFQC